MTYFAPVGEAPPEAHIHVAFDRPMVALAQDVSAADVLQVEPQVQGRARWVGSQTLVFEPSAPLAGATQFKVRVPRGLRALDGEALAEDLTFAFDTPAPAVVRCEPEDGATHELPTRGFELAFNQTVSVERVREAARVELEHAGKRRALEVEVSRGEDAGDAKRVRIQPKERLPLGARVTLTLAAGLTGEEGPRAMPEAFRATFSVYGPLKLSSTNACAHQEGTCSPHGGALIRFSNPVQINDVYARLRFDPPLPEPLRPLESGYVTEAVYLGAQLAPMTRYTVRIEGELKDVFGNSFTGPRALTLRTGAYEPWASFGAYGELLPRGVPAALPVRLSNLPSPRVTLFAVKPEEVEALATRRLAAPKRKGTSLALAPAGPSERTSVLVDLAPALDAGKGVVLVQVTDAKRGREELARSLVAVTNLSPTLKFGRDSGLVWVSELGSANPVASARVRVVDCGNTLAQGKTDAQGLFRFALPKSPECELYAIVDKDGDVSFAHQYAGVGPWELTSNYQYQADGPHDAFLFTERGVYRPGETLRLKGILRTRTDKGLTPTRGRVKLRVTDSRDREVGQEELTLSAFGSFSHALRIPGSVPLGPLVIRVEHEGQAFHTYAEVAEFRRAELDVEVRVDREQVVRGARAQVQVRGQYMFGAPVSEQRVLWSVRRLERDMRPPGERLEGFTFGDETRWYEEIVAPEETTLAGGEGKLDARGELALSVPVDLELWSGVAGLEVEATVEGLGGAWATGRTVMTVTPAEFLVGLRPSTSLITAGQGFAVEFAAAKLSGEPVSKVALEGTLTRRVYGTELKEGPAGRKEFVHTHRDETVGTCRVTTQRGFATCTLTAKAAGLHFLRVQGRDGAGRRVHAALPLYAAGAGAAGWGERDGPVMTLKAERARYRVGERAKILVASPFDEAEALITVEREGVLSVERRRLTGRAPILEMPIDARFVPNAFVSVLLARPQDAAGAASDPLAYRVGAVEIVTDTSAHRLQVAVQPDAEDKRPGESVSVELAVRDAAGKPVKAELTVFAVDEGVLALTGYRTPDPFELFYAPKGLSVWTADGRARLLKALGNDEQKGGNEGGGGGEGTTLRKDFDAVAFYVPDLATDDGGRARVTFRLPDSLTRYRVMAVASSAGAEVGAGEARVRTHKPLMLRPSLPRAVRVGDAFEAGGAVHNETERDLDVTVRADLDGLVATGPTQQRVRVPRKSAVDVRFGLRADRPGSARLRFTLQAGDERDAVELSRAVSLATPLEAVSTSGETQAQVREALGALSGVRSDAGGLILWAATSALADLVTPTQALLDYPYACTEQLASRLIGLSAMATLQKRGLIEAQALGAKVELALGALEQRQKGDGSFGLWSSEEHGLPGPLSAFVTAYALLAMDELARAGLASPHQAMESARSYLGQYLRSDRAKVEPGLDALTATFAVYALARTGQVDASYAGTLYERRAQLPLEARVQLAHVLQLANQTDKAEALLDGVLTQLRVTADEAHLEENLGDAYGVVMASDLRSTAQLVLLLLAREPNHPMLSRLSRWIAGARERDGTWGTTQRNAWGLLAMAAFAEARERARPDLVVEARVNDRALAQAHLVGAKARAFWSVPMTDLPATGASLLLDKRGDGPLYYGMRLTYARSEVPRTPEERGLFVERTYERVDPAALARGDTRGELSTQARVGDYVRVTLRVAVPSTRRYVVLEDPLPAGLEPVNFALLTESRAAASALGLAQGPLDHSELRDTHVMFTVNQLEPGLYEYRYLARASTPGVYGVPPARVSEMYRPETFGRTGATTFEVRGP